MNTGIIKPPKYLLRLSSTVNEQYFLFGSEAARLEEECKDIDTQWVKVSSLKVARNITRCFLTNNDVGASNWTGGQVFNKSGLKIGSFSYNCRFWRREHPLETESNKIKNAPFALLDELH